MIFSISKSRTYVWTCLGFGILFAAPSMAADPQPATTKGFVVTRFVTAMYEGPTGRTAAWEKSDGQPECPDGFADPIDVDGILNQLKIPSAEQQRLKRPENLMPLTQTLLRRGEGGANVCRNPETAPDPGFKTVKGKIAYGLNLDGADDGAARPQACSHQNFVGPNGEKGIDNQLYRALGCIKGRRQGAHLYNFFNAGMRQGDYTILIEITGMDNPRNDPQVGVGFYISQDAMVNNPDGVSLTHTSLRVHHDSHYHALTRGKIVNGVLTTEPVDILFKNTFEVRPYRFRDTQFRGELQADGSMKGILGGYQDIVTIYRDISFGYDWVAEGPVHGPMSCPGLYYALKRLADAYPDPNGECGWISSAYEVDALPAFVIHPKEEQVVADQAAIETASEDSWWKKLTRRGRDSSQ